MIRRLWLLFAQAVTLGLATLFVLSTLKPEWLPAGGRNHGYVIQQMAPEAPVVASSAAMSGSASFSRAARQALPTVVHIFTSKQLPSHRHPMLDIPLFERFFGVPEDFGPRHPSGLGSGVIVSADGLVLTNYHVVQQADGIEVALNDGSKVRAHLVGGDPESDLAVLKLDADGPLPAITFAPPDSLSVGDVVLAIGNPFGVGQTVTMGIASALERSQLGINTFENYIQTDAAINPGNSGGALVDAGGNLVGINTAIYSRSGGSLGIGFAIPVAVARDVLEQIITTGSVTRGWVGVQIQDVTSELARSFGLAGQRGALISGVLPGSPAAEAGLMSGDVITAINRQSVTNTRALLTAIAALKPGTRATLQVIRERKVQDVAVNIGRRPAPENS